MQVLRPLWQGGRNSNGVRMARKPTTKAAPKAAKTPEFTVEMWPIDRLIPYDNNPRVLTPAAIDKVAKSIETFGWQQAIVVDTDGVIIVGHTRLQAAKKLGHKHVPVKIAVGLDEERVRAYRIADNRVAEETDWDEELLKIELLNLEDTDLLLNSLGFDDKELEALMKGAEALSLDQMAEKHGEHDPDNFWPVVRLKVPPEVKEAFDAAMKALTGEEHERFAELVRRGANCRSKAA